MAVFLWMYKYYLQEKKNKEKGLTINTILGKNLIYLQLPASTDCKKQYKLLKYCVGHVVWDNLCDLEINWFYCTKLMLYCFWKKVDCIAIFLVTAKKKYSFSSNIHVLWSKKYFCTFMDKGHEILNFKRWISTYYIY